MQFLKDSVQTVIVKQAYCHLDTTLHVAVGGALNPKSTNQPNKCIGIYSRSHMRVYRTIGSLVFQSLRICVEPQTHITWLYTIIMKYMFIHSVCFMQYKITSFLFLEKAIISLNLQISHLQMSSQKVGPCSI